MYWMNANHAPRFSTLRRWLPSAKNWSSIRPAEPGTSCSYSRMMDGGSMGTVTWTPNPARVLELVERGVIAPAFRIEEHAAPVLRLLNKYADQQMQFADACLVRMSEITSASRVFTIDRTDFSVYRRFERRVIPLIAPREA